MRPDEIYVVKGEGMPLGKRRDGFGDLYLQINIIFPDDNFLSEKGEYKTLINLLPQRPIKVPGSQQAPKDGEHRIEDDIHPVLGALESFGGEEAQNGWEDEAASDIEEPGVQCAQQ